jgi:hypothetical protein
MTGKRMTKTVPGQVWTGLNQNGSEKFMEKFMDRQEPKAGFPAWIRLPRQWRPAKEPRLQGKIYRWPVYAETVRLKRLAGYLEFFPLEEESSWEAGEGSGLKNGSPVAPAIEKFSPFR